MCQQQTAGLGGNSAPAITCKQVLPQLHLQQSHLPTQGRLGYTQGDSGARKAAEFGHADKIFQLFQIHTEPAISR